MKLTLKIGRRRLSVPRRVIRRAVQEVLSMPDSEFDFENPKLPTILKKEVPRKKPVKKLASKNTAAKKPKPKSSSRR